MTITALEGLTREESAVIEAVAAHQAGNLTDDGVLTVAAQLLGQSRREVSSVEDTPAGVVISMTVGGVLYIVVRPDKPDGAGHHGLMATRPMGRMPVYTAPAAAVLAPRPPLTEDPGEIDTVAGARERQRYLAERLPLVEEELGRATSMRLLTELEEERDSIRRELEVLDNRVPILNRNQARAKSEADRRRQEASVRAVRRCYVEADPVFAKIIEAATELAEIRRRAMEAGADRELMSGRRDTSSTTPSTGERQPGFDLLDRLTAYVTGPWVPLVAEARKLLEESGDPADSARISGRRRGRRS